MVERQPLADRIGDLDKNREPAYRVTQCGRGYRLAAKQRGKRPRRGGIKARLLNGIRALWQAAPPSVRARRSDNNCYHSLPGTTSDNAAAGAWTPYSERRLYLFDSREIIAGTFGMVRSHKIGEAVAVGDQGMRILAQGGFIEVSRVRLDDGPKIPATEAGVRQGTILGTATEAL
jgi:hypothetical protein